VRGADPLPPPPPGLARGGGLGGCGAPPGHPNPGGPAQLRASQRFSPSRGELAVSCLRFRVILKICPPSLHSPS